MVFEPRVSLWLINEMGCRLRISAAEMGGRLLINASSVFVVGVDNSADEI